MMRRIMCVFGFHNMIYRTVHTPAYKDIVSVTYRECSRGCGLSKMVKMWRGKKGRREWTEVV